MRFFQKHPVLCGILFFALLTANAYGADRLIFSGESPYTGMQVYDKEDGLRYLQFGLYEQTAIRPGLPEYLHYPYTRTVMAAFAFADPPAKKVLMLGLGGGAMANFIAREFPEVSLDIMELDPMVVEVAKRYFGFRETEKVRVHVGDGRRILAKQVEKYDVIILDAYKAGGIPFYLTTLEFMQVVKEHVTPGGVAVFHLWAEYANIYLHSQIATIDKAFPRSYSFDDGANSFMIFATPRKTWIPPKTLVERGERLTRERGLSFRLDEVISKQYTRVERSELKGEILTDDYAPVNLLREKRIK